jgi:hypothetical protein
LGWEEGWKRAADLYGDEEYKAEKGRILNGKRFF